MLNAKKQWETKMSNLEENGSTILDGIGNVVQINRCLINISTQLHCKRAQKGFNFCSWMYHF